MKRPAAVFILLLFVLSNDAQKVQTIVPRQVVAGNAFQIQYVISNPLAFENITAPQFDNLHLVSGPNYYKGNSSVNGKAQAIENIAYTVVPLKTGTVRINPAIIKFKNSEEQTDAILINVLPQPKASFNTQSTYTDINLYAPSSKTNLDGLIEQNLFIKAEVDRHTCFLGEAITASFKLYSRLQSSSEVINSPSLYGFSMMDMLDINEAHQAVETINGKVFNTSVLRKLQLYPAQTGQLTIDPMQLQNTIEFDDSVTGKKIKIEKILASTPVNIIVKPLPKQPADFTGAVGRFAISTGFQNTKIAENAQGKLVVIVSGKGNFIQLGTPVVNWPKGFDVFEPMVSEELEKNVVPTEGKATYVFSFTSDRIGHYVIPPVSFSFFDPSSGKYKTVASDSLQFEIVPASKSVNKSKSAESNSSINSWRYTVITTILLAAAAFIFLRKGKTKSIQPVTVTKPNYLDKLNHISTLQLTDKEFCSQLQNLLNKVRKEYTLLEQQETELQSIKNNCQLLVYSDITSVGRKEELRLRAEKLIKQL